MCLGIPGRVVAAAPGADLAQVDVAGVVRDVHVGLLDGQLQPGEYILIHSGFALERMTAEQARDALAVFGPDPAPLPRPYAVPRDEGDGLVSAGADE